MSDGFTGTNPVAVLELLKERRERAPGRDDGRKLALIVEGGGMRGVLSAGSLLAVDVLGFRSVFDEVYATSAGAVNAAYFLSGQGALGITIYWDSINNRHFINPFRLSRIVDVEYVYDHVVREVKVLDDDAIRSGRPDLWVSVTDALTGANVLLDVKRTPETVAQILKASSAMPVLYNKTVRVGDREYVDGGVTSLLPIVQAAGRGCTDVLTLLTRPEEYRPSRPGKLRRALLYAMIGRRYPALMRSYREGVATAERERRIAMGEERLSGVNVATLGPAPDAQTVERTTTDRGRLVEGAHRMARAAARLLGEDPGLLDGLFEGYRGSG